MSKFAEFLKPIRNREETGNRAADLTPFFSPRCVAIIGASPHADNLGQRIIDSLVSQGYPGKILTVHPQGKTVSNFPVVRHVSDLPKSVDLAIAAVSAPNAVSLIKPLAEKGTLHMIVISGGFSETGIEGEKLQRLLLTEARKYGMRIIGPNGLGVFSAPDKFNSLFLLPGEIKLPKPGPVGIISQSGAFMAQILDQMAVRGVGVNKAVNFGNRIDVGECEILEEFEKDPAVKVIGIYLESFADGQRFVKTAQRVGIAKPIIICKGGHGREGNKAAMAHSASLAGSYEVFQAACVKAGLIEVQGLAEMVDAVYTLAQAPAAKGSRILIVSNGGGMGVMLTDLCEKAGLKVPEPSAVLRDKLRETFPAYFSFQNPIDLTGSGTNEQCAQAAKLLLKTGEYDALLMVLLAGTPGITPEIASLSRSYFPRDIPIVIGAYGRTMYPKMAEAFRKDGIPVFESGEAAVKALELLVRVGKRSPVSREERSLVKEWFFFMPGFFSPASVILKSADAGIEEDSASEPMVYNSRHTRGWLDEIGQPPDEMKIKDLLHLCGALVPSHFHMETLGDVKAAEQFVKYPMVLKVADPAVIHKTEANAVRLGLKDEISVMREWKIMNKTHPNKVWAEKEMPPGLDLMAGAHRDRQFGPVLLFGTGGRYVEIYDDIQRILLPATEEEILALIFKTKAGQIIKGTRGEGPLDIEHLSAFLLLVADWMVHEPKIESMDFNPIRLYKDSLVALDAKICLANLDEKRQQP